MAPRISVGGLPESTDSSAIVVVDVLRATTVLCTAAALGRPCLVAATVEEAVEVVAATPGALLAGEQGGRVPEGFDLGNSPAEVARRDDVDRPMVLVTSSGTPLLRSAAGAPAVFAACLRNITAQVERLVELGTDVTIIPAGTRGSPREEDDLCAAYLAAGLSDAGLKPDAPAREHIARWGHLPVSVCADGPSAAFLRRAGHSDDLDYVLSHVDDLGAAFPLDGRRIRCEPVP